MVNIILPNYSYCTQDTLVNPCYTHSNTSQCAITNFSVTPDTTSCSGEIISLNFSVTGTDFGANGYTVTANNGYYYQNNNSRVITAIDQTRVLSFPIILAEDYTKLTTSSNFNSSVDCGGGSYSKGTVCTLIVEAKGGITDNVATVNLRGTLPNGQQNQLTLNTLVTVTSSPNLIIGGTGLIINPANGADANQIEVTMFNAGDSDATGINITPAAPLTVSTSGVSTPCVNGGSLAASASCSFKVNAESEISGQNTVTVTDAEEDSQSINVFLCG